MEFVSSADERRGQGSKVLRRSTLLALLALTMGLVTACGGQPPGSGDRLSIATGGSGGVYSVYGGGLANQISKNVEGYEATAETTSASVDNMNLIDSQSSDMAFALADTAADAVNGEAQFDQPVPAQAIGQLYTNYNHVVTTEGSDIQSIEDLEGKTVSLGSPGSGTEITALRILEAAGIDPETDIETRNLGVSESVDALGDGSVDAFFWSGGLPTGAVTDAATTSNIRLLDISNVVEPLQEEYGDVYQVSTIPGDTYSGVEEDVKTIGVPNYLVVNEAMDEQLAYDLTRVLFEQKDALVQVHPAAKSLDLETAQQVKPLQIHPGAQRYYDEQ